MFGMMDFITAADGGLYLFDGKGNAQTDADVRQLLYYGLILMASGKTVKGGGFLYWKHGLQKIDLSPSALKHFVDSEDYQKGVEVFRKLREGADKLAAIPSSSNCQYCEWKASCPVSHYKKEFTDMEQSEVGFVPLESLVKGSTT
jgi:hypothetical protein